jgi:quinol monooxygenase YgiN
VRPGELAQDTSPTDNASAYEIEASPKETHMKVDVIAHLHAKPGREGDLRNVLESFVAPTRQEDGCLRYDLFVDLDQPTKFTFIEEWASRDALVRHGESAHIAAGRKLFPELLAEPAWVQVATRIA